MNENELERRLDLAHAIGQLDGKVMLLVTQTQQITLALATLPAITTDVVRLKADVAAHDTQLQDLTNFKNKGIGILSGVTVGAGAVGAGLREVIERFLAHVR